MPSLHVEVAAADNPGLSPHLASGRPDLFCLKGSGSATLDENDSKLCAHGHAEQLTDYIKGSVPVVQEVTTKEKRDVIYVEFDQNDPRDPFNFSLAQKWLITVCVSAYISLAGGAFGSGSSLAAGTLADIWLPHERGLPMSLFSICAVGATGLGPVFAGYVEMNPHLEWRWIQWIHLMMTGSLAIIFVFFMKETRSAILLARMAKKLRKETGDQRYRARAEEERASFKTLLIISLTRPIYFMFTEPVVASFSIWIGFSWGITYVLVESISPVFRTLHNFNTGSTGLVFVTFFIGSLIGIASDQIQGRLYRANISTRGPEARLYHAMFAGVLFPASMFIYAWCTFPSVPWIALAIGITVRLLATGSVVLNSYKSWQLFMWSSFIIYLCVFNYLADCYGPFASSALAGQALCRKKSLSDSHAGGFEVTDSSTGNITASTFPLFTQQMYAALTYKWANTIFAFIAAVMIPIPFVLFFYGPRIRARSKFASLVIHQTRP
ncbi:hypothetical protein EIP91_011190 [Steccherinum ochraceum]|uniref:Major facilitator superfamily (MFS) profile domain-containing protein n=1 Tax=Steccherinum ochraceum TaxID=92696 RepID=A0A4R0QZY8_9APHY|nr:hypothetical protein EIP91_011190 [Steccherinum ochraceum]